MPHYITDDEYARDQNSRKEATDAAIDQVREALRAFKTEVVRRFNVVDARLGNINGRFDMMKDEFVEIRAQNERLREQLQEQRLESLRFHNSSLNARLRNPILPIFQLPAWDPEKGIVNPDHFPNNANEFYGLRDPKTPQQKRMLVYLGTFYDLHDPNTKSDSRVNEDDDIVMEHPTRTFELLEMLLGLNEDNFTKFKERAQEKALQDMLRPESPIKRSHLASPSRPGSPPPRRPRLELRQRPDSVNEPDSSGSWGTNDVLEWRKRSTPSQRPSVGGLDQREQEKGSSDTGGQVSMTNPNTPRDPTP